MTHLLIRVELPADRTPQDSRNRISAVLKALPPWLRQWRFVDDTDEELDQ